MKPFLLILVLVGATYAPTLTYEFVWDDLHFIRDNPKIKSLNQWHHFFIDSTTVSSDPLQVRSIYRPLRTLLYACLYQIGNGSVIPFHLFNLLLHLACTYLTYLVVQAMSQSKRVSLLAAALFAVHPVHCEAVTWISGVADPLFSLFFLLAFLGVVHCRQSWCAWLAIVVVFPLALLAKETAIVLPAILFLWYWFCDKEKIRMRETQIRLATTFIIAVIYFSTRQAVIQNLSQIPLHEVSILENLFFVPYTFISYVSMFAFPYPLNAQRPTFVMTPSMQSLGILAWAVAIMLSIFIYKRSHSKSWKYRKPTFFMTSWFVLGLLPVINLVPIRVSIAERFHYLPGIALFIGAAIGLDQGLRHRRIFAFVSTFLVGLLMVMTMIRNPVWRDRITLYTDTARKSPLRPEAHWNLAVTAYEHKDYATAILAYENFNRLTPGYFEAYLNLAFAYGQIRNYDQAIVNGKRAAKVRPDDFRAYANLSGYYMGKRSYDTANELIRKALSLKSDDYRLHVQAASVGLALGDIHTARKHLHNADSLADDPIIQTLLAKAKAQETDRQRKNK